MGYLVLPQAPPVNTADFWNVNGNNTLLNGAYIGSNDPSVDDFEVIMNNNRYLFTSGNNLNIYLGQEAGRLTTDGGGNIGIGQNAGFNSIMDNSIMIGNGSGFANINPGSLIAIGNGSAESNTGARPVFIGILSGVQNSGNENIGIGENVLNFNTGNYVIAIGKNAGYDPISLSFNQLSNQTIINTNYLPFYNNYTDAVNTINVLNGAVPGNTYLYRTSGNKIEYVTIP